MCSPDDEWETSYHAGSFELSKLNILSSVGTVLPVAASQMWTFILIVYFVIVNCIFCVLCFLHSTYRFLPCSLSLFSTDPAAEMAVRQRIFNSTAPFSGSSQAELKGSYPSCSAADQGAAEEEEEEEGGGGGGGKDSKVGFMAGLSPLINKLLTHGTAEQVGERPLKTSTFIAQAECKHVLLTSISHSK